MTSCPKCGRANRPNSRFCNVCGWRLDLVVNCPSCEAINAGDAVFCNECGATLTPQPAAFNPAPPVEVPPSVTQTEPPTESTIPTDYAHADEPLAPVEVDAAPAEPSDIVGPALVPDGAELPRADTETTANTAESEAVAEVAPEPEPVWPWETNNWGDSPIIRTDAGPADTADVLPEEPQPALASSEATSEPASSGASAPPATEAAPPIEFDWSAIADLEAITPEEAEHPAAGELRDALGEQPSLPLELIAPAKVDSNGSSHSHPASTSPSSFWLDSAASDDIAARPEPAPALAIEPTADDADEPPELAEPGIALARSLSTGRPRIGATSAAPSLDSEAAAFAAAAVTPALPVARSARRFPLPEWLIILILAIIVATAFVLTVTGGLLDLASVAPPSADGLAAAVRSSQS